MVSVARAPAAAAQVDLTARQVVVAACAAMAIITGIDLIDGRLGAVFAIGFVMVAGTAPLAVDHRGLAATAFLPPLLLPGIVTIVALAMPDAIAVTGLPKDTTWVGRAMVGVVSNGIALLVGYATAISVITARVTSRR